MIFSITILRGERNTDLSVIESNEQIPLSTLDYIIPSTGNTSLDLHCYSP